MLTTEEPAERNNDVRNKGARELNAHQIDDAHISIRIDSTSDLNTIKKTLETKRSDSRVNYHYGSVIARWVAWRWDLPARLHQFFVRVPVEGSSDALHHLSARGVNVRDIRKQRQ